MPKPLGRIAQLGRSRGPAIQRVTEHGRTALREVNADLVRAPRLERALDERGAFERRNHGNVGDGSFAAPHARREPESGRRGAAHCNVENVRGLRRADDNRDRRLGRSSCS